MDHFKDQAVKAFNFAKHEVSSRISERTNYDHGPPFTCAIFGCGGINFGSAEGPWNNSEKLELVLGHRLKVIALLSPHKSSHERVLKQKAETPYASCYNTVQEFYSADEYIQYLTEHPGELPHAFIIGIPPETHGSTAPGADMELALLKRFPNASLFIEKPISAAPVEDAFAVAKQIPKEAVISVGYMLRYLKVVQKAKEIIREKNLKVVSTIAKYNSAYIHNNKVFWWVMSQSGGPVVEQGTHFCDLSRFFGGDVDTSTVRVQRVNWDDAPGKLSAMPFDENKEVPPHERIPRFTAAVWKYKEGGVGSFTHNITLQGTKYDTCIEVQADGYYLRIVDLYGDPVLYVRSPESDNEQKYHYPGDDPYYAEFKAFLEAAEGKGPRSAIQSDFMDAVKSYELTKVITAAK
ncbi:NAD binding dehydrogenase [Schizosaccharomyces octosporus yFS286]|uniref:NAD binding dehydrogenase n=1 Tax=Schizosaccharomyces octosporus (strain yFS286) TaxID=483514 RepID=S9PQQ1_SCHOY|nr:NAD binding dehydrogenase [Schizosaccharomyces octosporus yFS286]EPX71516.1 NAD binding dehydrogenase [Schizosaccharomyces octosporus yFS286]